MKRVLRWLPATRLLSPLLLLMLLLTALLACSGPRPAPPAAGSAAGSAAGLAAAELGITIVGIYQSAGGYMLDFRYRVEDPDKAGPLFDHNIIPYLVHDETGARFAVPAPAKSGPMRQMPRSAEAGRVYFIFFANPAKYVKPGDHVTIVHGPYRFEHLEVL